MSASAARSNPPASLTRMALPCLWVMATWLALAGTAATAAHTVVTVADDTPVRAGPSGNDPRVAVLEADIPLWAEDRLGQWVRVALREGLDGWVHHTSIRHLPPDAPPPPARLTSMTISPHPLGTTISLSLSDRRPYRVVQLVEERQLRVEVFGARLAHYGFSALPVEPFITSIRPHQTAPETVEITFDLTAAQQTGYTVGYDALDRLVVEVRRPYTEPGLRGRLIFLDPGHGGQDRGAVGPRGLEEKDVNLRIALMLKDLLEARGARGAMTRDRDTSLLSADATKRQELTARVKASRDLWPDLFLSIHNNHVGRGDPLRAAGTEAYYYTAMSERPAAIIHRNLTAHLGTQSRRVAARPFRVLRSTDTPRVLVECAYLSHPREEALLADEAFLRRAAEGLCAGLEEVFQGEGVGHKGWISGPLGRATRLLGWLHPGGSS